MGLPKPSESWLAGTITTDLNRFIKYYKKI